MPKPLFLFLRRSMNINNTIIDDGFQRSEAIRGMKLDIQGFGLKRQEIGSCNIVE